MIKLDKNMFKKVLSLTILILANLIWLSSTVLADEDYYTKSVCQSYTGARQAFIESHLRSDNPFPVHPLYDPNGYQNGSRMVLNIPPSQTTSLIDEAPTLSDAEKTTVKNNIPNQVYGCCFEKSEDIIYDKNHDCELDATELCQQNIDIQMVADNEECQRKQADPNASVASIQEACLKNYSCDNNGEAISTTADNEFTPHSSEYFSINDENKGLTADGQGSAYYDNLEKGPIFTFINQVTGIMVGLVSTIAFAILIVGAYLLITSNGDDNQIEKGKNTIKFALIGLVFVLLSFTIVRLVQSILF